MSSFLPNIKKKRFELNVDCEQALKERLGKESLIAELLNEEKLFLCLAVSKVVVSFVLVKVEGQQQLLVRE